MEIVFLVDRPGLASDFREARSNARKDPAAAPGGMESDQQQVRNRAQDHR
jgi:hypothetical protein